MNYRQPNPQYSRTPTAESSIPSPAMKEQIVTNYNNQLDRGLIISYIYDLRKRIFIYYLSNIKIKISYALYSTT